MSYLLAQASAHALPLADESVQCVVTSPPYWGLREYEGDQAMVWGGDADCVHEWGATARKYHPKVSASTGLNGGPSGNSRKGYESNSGAFCECGAWRGSLGLEPTPELYVEHMVAIMRELWRVLRPDGTLWLNLGDSYASTAGGYDANGSAGATSWAVAPSTKAAVLGGRNRVPPPGLKAKDLIGIPWRVALALQADGWWLRSDIVWSKPNPMPESVTDRPTKAHEYIFLLTKSERYYYDADAIKAPVEASTIARLSQNGGHPVHNGERERGYPGAPQTLDVQRMSDKLRKSDATEINGRNVQTVNSEAERRDQIGTFNNNPRLRPDTGRNARTVWEIPTQPYPGAHFATFPRELAERCIKAGSAPGDVVLDPFNGSGTTGRASVALQRCYVGLDLSRGYLGQALERVDPIAATAKAGEQGVLL